MMHLEPPAPLACTTAPGLASPHLGSDRTTRRHKCGTPFPPDDDLGFGFQDPHRRAGYRVEAAIVRSAQTRTPGICTAPLSARTTPPSFTWSIVKYSRGTCAASVIS